MARFMLKPPLDTKTVNIFSLAMGGDQRHVATHIADQSQHPVPAGHGKETAGGIRQCGTKAHSAGGAGFRNR
jgi:hypothetical protein